MDYSPNPNRPRGILPVLCWGHRKIPVQKGIITFVLGANRQRPLAGVVHNAVFNTARRCRGQILYVVPPFLGAYWLLTWANEKNRWLNSKEGRLATAQLQK